MKFLSGNEEWIFSLVGCGAGTSFLAGEHELFIGIFNLRLGVSGKQVQGEQAKVRFCEHRLGNPRQATPGEANRLALQMSMGREQEETGEALHRINIGNVPPAAATFGDIRASGFAVVTQRAACQVVLDQNQRW